MPPTAGPSMTGTLIQADCDVSVNQNAGCGVQAPTTDDSFGPAFNAGGGGWYAMERTTDIIQVWFWARNDTTVLNDLESGADGIVTDNWVSTILTKTISCLLNSNSTVRSVGCASSKLPCKSLL